MKDEKIRFDFWACQRPLTKSWGSGQVFNRIMMHFERPDIVFGKTDGIPNYVMTVDKNEEVDPTFNCDWKKLPFKTNQFEFGYWDPPYDKLYKNEGKEIWRVCKKLAILHTLIFPISWLKDAKRVAMIAVTMGPMKRIRCLQVFEKIL